MKRPKILEDAGLDIYVDESKLRDIDVPISQMEVSEFEWLLDLPVWERDGTDDWNLTPRETLESRPNTTNHRAAIERADLSCPIVIISNKGKWIILDGFHRLARAHMLGHAQINVKILTSEMKSYQDALIKKF